jgi:hypothetical protein
MLSPPRKGSLKMLTGRTIVPYDVQGMSAMVW